MNIARAGEVELKSDNLNVWDPEFGWILKNGKPTITTNAYWQAMKRRVKQ